MRSFIVAVLAVGVTMVGCHCRSHSQRKVDSTLLSYQDFDLATVVGVVKDNKVKGAQELEKFVNNDNGVNNVDVDKDKKVDYVSVVESRSGPNINLDFVANPSSGEGEKVTIANLKFSQTAGSDQLTVQGGYPEYVDGHSVHHYSYHQPRYGISTGEALFLMWLMSPGRSVYSQPMPTYSPRSTLSGSTLTSKRTVTRTNNKVSPVPKITKPSSYSIKSAQKTQSKLKSKGTSAFRTRAYNKQRQKATGFGAKPKTTKPKSRGSSWGRSPSRRSSPSRSRSFGGGRRRSSIQYKSNVMPNQSGLRVVEQLEAVNWDWKEQQGNIKVKAPTVGFIAEDVAKVMPDLVYSKDGKVEGINYDLIVVPLVNAVKEQQAQINQLSDELNSMKKEAAEAPLCH